MKNKEITNVMLVKNPLNKQHIWSHTCQLMMNNDITNVILVENPSLNQVVWISTSRHSLHGGERNHKCDSCGKAFTGLGNLKTHTKTIHEEQRNVLCSSWIVLVWVFRFRNLASNNCTFFRIIFLLGFLKFSSRLRSLFYDYSLHFLEYHIFLE